MEITKDVWRIAEFGEKVNAKFQQKHGLNDKVHHNTIDKWFKELEEARVHYVQRIADKKVYSELDFNIALYIMDRRLEKWNLEAIYNVVGEVLEVRPFPEEFEFQAPILNEQHLMNLFESKMAEYKEGIVREVKLQMDEEMQLKLPRVKSEDELLMEKKELMLTWARKQLNLKSEAIKEWERQADSIRFKKVGFFRKEEDLVEREKFIDKYISDHLKAVEKGEKDL